MSLATLSCRVHCSVEGFKAGSPERHTLQPGHGLPAEFAVGPRSPRRRGKSLLLYTDRIYATRPALMTLLSWCRKYRCAVITALLVIILLWVAILVSLRSATSNVPGRSKRHTRRVIRPSPLSPRSSEHIANRTYNPPVDLRSLKFTGSIANVAATISSLRPSQSLSEGNSKHRFVFLTFGSTRYNAVRDQLAGNATSCDDGRMFSRVFNYTESYTKGLPDYKTIMEPLIKLHPRGWGYWSFKSVLVLHTLERMDPDDVLLYVDADLQLDCQLGREAVLYAWKSLLEGRDNPKDILAFQNGHPERLWTKGDTFDHFGARNDSAVFGTSQTSGGVFFLRKTRSSVEVMRRWLGTFGPQTLHIVSDAKSKAPNFPGFHSHRHDQSVLSVMLKQYPGALILPDPLKGAYWSAIRYST